MGRRLGLLAALVVLGVGALLLHPRVMRAGEWWSWDDPVLQVNGRVMHVYAGVPEQAVGRVTGAAIVITVPEGVDARLTAVNAPRFPLTAQIVRGGAVNPDGSITMMVRLTVNGYGQFDTGLKIDQPSGTEIVTYGSSNQEINASMVVAPKANEGRGPDARPAVERRR